jgi:hypothetical protein
MLADEAIPTIETGLQPGPGFDAAVDQCLPDSLKHLGVGVGQQANQRSLVLLRKRGQLQRICQQSLHHLVKRYLRTHAQGRQPRVIHNARQKKTFINHERREKPQKGTQISRMDTDLET